MRLHPEGFLHVSLQEPVFFCKRTERPDEISAERLKDFTPAAAAPLADRAPFDVSLGKLNSFQDAAFLDVHDDGACGRLHARLFELAAVGRSPGFAFLPHVTIGHYTSAAPLARITSDLPRRRGIRFATFPVTAVEIVTLRLDVPYPDIEPYALVPLSG